MKKRNILLSFLLMCAVCFIGSCNQNNSSNNSTNNPDDKPSETTYYSITIEECSGGNISVDKNRVQEGETVTLTLTVDDGYNISKVTITYGDNNYDLNVTLNTATFIMPACDVAIEAEFVEDLRELVDYLILGDSYTDIDGWSDFYSDMRDLPSAKTIGVGGTTVPQWGKTGTKFEHYDEPTGGLDNEVSRWDGKIIKTDILGNYNVKNFVFHLGVNDIRSGISGDIVISDLKTLFSQYHEEYPNAHIYWVSLSLNVSDLHCTDTFKNVNNAIKEYASECDYLTYINTVDTMFPDGQPNADWFCDGLHFNADGYATWSSLITEALGYPRQDVDVFGSADIYYSSNTWNYDSATQTITNETLGTYSEQSLWFDGVYDVDMYAEMEICVNKAENTDEWPKVGMAVKGNGNHAFFFIETRRDLTGKTINYTERRPYANRYVECESSVWDWNIQGDNWTEVPSLSYTNGNYAKLGLLRCGADMYFFINDELVFSKGGFISCDDNMAIGLTLINLNVTIKNYSVTRNVEEIIAEYNIESAPSALCEEFYSKNFINTTLNGEIVKNVANFSASKLYYETNVTLDSVLTIPGTTQADEYPKFGISLHAGGNTLWFYIDALNNGNFGSNKVLGLVYRENGGGFNWAAAKMVEVPSMEYTNSSYAKLAVYKDGARMVFMVNDIPVFETSEFQALAGDVKVGISEYNLAFTTKEAKIATSDTILNLINEKIGFNYEIEIDGDLSDWSSDVKTNYYGKTATDNSGRSFKVYSFMGKGAVYVGYEITSTTFVDNTPEWWLSTNVEMRAKNNSNSHIYASANGQSNNVLCFSVKSNFDQATQLYTTYIEVVISYYVLGVTPEDASVNIMFAARPGNEEGAGMCVGSNGVWWCGDYNPEGNTIPFNITFDGIDVSIK